MRGAIFGRIVFLVNKMKNWVIPDKCFFPEQRYQMENFLYACPNNTAQFLKSGYHQCYWEEPTAGAARWVQQNEHLFMCSLLQVCNPGAALLVSIVWFIRLEEFLLKISMEEAGKSCSNRKVGLHCLGLCPHSFTDSFTTHSSLQWPLCATTH